MQKNGSFFFFFIFFPCFSFFLIFNFFLYKRYSISIIALSFYDNLYWLFYQVLSFFFFLSAFLFFFSYFFFYFYLFIFLRINKTMNSLKGLLSSDDQEKGILEEVRAPKIDSFERKIER